jgi:hypothetical protein
MSIMELGKGSIPEWIPSQADLPGVSQSPRRGQEAGRENIRNLGDRSPGRLRHEWLLLWRRLRRLFRITHRLFGRQPLRMRERQFLGRRLLLPAVWLPAPPRHVPLLRVLLRRVLRPCHRAESRSRAESRRDSSSSSQALRFRSRGPFGSASRAVSRCLCVPPALPSDGR